jgi:fermentation-respiration switch protein FrsA (DUF1100 family)
MTRRFAAQRWVLDNIVQANSIDWDQPRSIYLSAPCGPESGADFAMIRARVKKMADIGPAFTAVARRREAMARQAEADGFSVTARDNWFMAAIHYGAAEWPYDDNSYLHIDLHEKKRAAYSQYAKLADHHIEAVSVPFKGKHIPAWFHLPPGYNGGKIPVVIAITGMDGFKEMTVALNGDTFLNRGMAVLAIDGPGQYECPLLGLHFSMQNWIDTGPVLVDWLLSRPEVDGTKIGLTGISFGSFCATIVAANEPRIAATAIGLICLEPGCHTLFEEASPTFKKRFMWMSGFAEHDEDAFDAFARDITWEGHAERIQHPFLIVAGEADELSPLSNADRMLARMSGPRALVVYADARHALGGVPSTALGPFFPSLMADWVRARLDGMPFQNERWFVDGSGKVNKKAL